MHASNLIQIYRKRVACTNDEININDGHRQDDGKIIIIVSFLKKLFRKRKSITDS